MSDQYTSNLLKPQYMIAELLLKWPFLVHQVGSKRKISLGTLLLAAVRKAMRRTASTAVILIIYAYVTSTELYHCSDHCSNHSSDLHHCRTVLL